MQPGHRFTDLESTTFRVAANYRTDRKAAVPETEIFPELVSETIISELLILL